MPRPTQDQIVQDLQGLTPEQQSQYMDQLEKMYPAQGSVASGLSKVDTISETPRFQRPLSKVFSDHPVAQTLLDTLTSISGAHQLGIDQHVSPEDLVNMLPGLGGALGTAVEPGGGTAAGMALGSGAGEAARQLMRRLAGQPAATGALTSLTGMDPNSPTAAAANIGLEAALGPLAGKVSGKLSDLLGRSANRSAVNMMQPVTQKAKEDAMKLAARVHSEDILSTPIKLGNFEIKLPVATRTQQVSNAQSLLEQAKAASDALEAQGAARGVQVEGGPVLDQAIEQIPANLPTAGSGGVGGLGIARVGRSTQRATERAAEDVMDVLAVNSKNDLNVSFPVAVGERQRWDKLLQSYYKSGRVDPSISESSVKNIADTWRSQIADAFPEYGAANARLSDLITITDMMKEALKRQTTQGVFPAAQQAAAVGAGAFGRLGVLGAAAGKVVPSLGPVGSLSANGKNLVAAALKNPAVAQSWLRIAEPFFGQTGTPSSE